VSSESLEQDFVISIVLFYIVIDKVHLTHYCGMRNCRPHTGVLQFLLGDQRAYLQVAHPNLQNTLPPGKPFPAWPLSPRLSIIRITPRLSLLVSTKRSLPRHRSRKYSKVYRSASFMYPRPRKFGCVLKETWLPFGIILMKPTTVPSATVGPPYSYRPRRMIKSCKAPFLSHSAHSWYHPCGLPRKLLILPYAWLSSALMLLTRRQLVLKATAIFFGGLET